MLECTVGSIIRLDSSVLDLVPVFQKQTQTLAKWQPPDEDGRMNMTTFSPKFQFLTEKSGKNYRKVGLYAANFLCALFLIRYGRSFSDALTIPCSIVVISVFLYAAFTRLRRFGEGSRVKAYIKGHEAWALILLAIFLILGTMFYVGFESRVDAGSGSPKIATS